MKHDVLLFSEMKREKKNNIEMIKTKKFGQGLKTLGSQIIRYIAPKFNLIEKFRPMIAKESPILLEKACELFVKDITVQAWKYAEEGQRKT